MLLPDLRKQLDEKKISSFELTKLYLDKIKKADNILNSYITVDYEGAVKKANDIQALIDSGSCSPMTGIPISIKDNICTEGLKTTCASKMLDSFIPPYNATVVKKLNNAVILGKTNMDEFGMGSDSSTSHYGTVKNPYNITRVSGGSSGGAAAAVAAGLCPAAIGTDTGGSIRQPASFCGVTGLVPTYGTVSRYGLIAFASSLDRIGIIARSAEDTDFVLDCIAGHDERDMTSHSTAFRTAPKTIKGQRIAVIKELMNSSCAHIEKAAKFYKECGAELVEISVPSFKLATSAYYIIASAEAASNLARYDGVRYTHRAENCKSFDELIIKSRTEGFGDEVKRRILFGNFILSGDNYSAYFKKAQQARNKICDDYKKIFETCDTIIAPTTPSGAYPFDMEITPTQKYHSDYCTVSSSLAGLPAITTTCAYDEDNMPLGMTLIAKPHDEKRIIFLCSEFEKQFNRQEADI